MSTGKSKGTDPDFAQRTAAKLLDFGDGKARLSGCLLEHLAAECGTPFFVYDANVLLRQFERLRRALPEAIDIYYSVKANPHPKVISVFVERGAGCEIASGGNMPLRAERAHPRSVSSLRGPARGATN